MPHRRLVLLSGGTGGARLARALKNVMQPGDHLTVIANVGDDFEHWGLHISPDVDAIMYHLAGLSHPRSWGIEGDAFSVLAEVEARGGSGWFQLGDRDLATHLIRTDHLRQGTPLSAVTARLAAGLGLPAGVKVLPASDDAVRTVVETPDGPRPFQEYLVQRQARDRVVGFRYVGSNAAEPAPGVLDALRQADVIVFGPSNPFVSLLPILAVREIREAVCAANAPRVAISPIIGGRALKGPLVEMMRALGRPATGVQSAKELDLPLDLLVLDPVDGDLLPAAADLGWDVGLHPIDFSLAVSEGTVRRLWYGQWEGASEGALP